MIKLVNTKNLSHEEWLLYRKQGIGGSDIASICGLNPFRSALSVYLDKTSDTVESIDNERMRIGRDLEDYVAKRFEEETGKKVRRNNFLMAHDDYPYLIANIDREVIGENAILECKTTNSYAKKDWENGVPDYYALQCHHYMNVMELDRVYIAVLIGNEAFKYYTIERDEEIIESLLAISKDFWENHIEKKEEPNPDGSDEYTKRLEQKYEALDKSVNLTTEANKTRIERLETIKGLIKDLETEENQIKQELMIQMEDSEVAYIDEHKLTWKTQERISLDTKRIKAEMPELYEAYGKKTESRVFRLR